jgi:hypothetical protein
MIKKTWPVLALVLFWAVFFYRPLFQGEIFYFGDNFSFCLPALEFFTDQLKLGHLPLWNPYVFTGLPFLSDTVFNLLNSLNLFFFIFTSFKALTWEIMAHLLLSSFFTFLFLRSLKRSQFEAVLGGVIFAYSSSLLTYSNNISILSTAYLLPLVFWAGQKTLTRGQSWPAVLSLVMAIQIISGHPQPIFYSFASLAFYFLFFPKLPFSKKLKRGSLAVTFAFLLSFFQTWPFLELASFSTRPSSSFSYATAWSLHPLLLIRFFLPHFFGAANKGFSWGPAYRMVADNTGYFGLLTIFFLFFGLKKRKKSFSLCFFTSLFVLSLLLALGSYTPVFSLFYRFFPGFRLFRNPTQILLLTNFSASILAALLWPSFLSFVKTARSKKIFKLSLLATAFSSFLLLVFLFAKKDLFIPFYQQLNKLYFLFKNQPLSASPFHTLQIDQVIFENLLLHFFQTSLFLFLFFTAINIFQKKKIRQPAFSWLILILVFANLMAFNQNNYFSAPPERLTGNDYDKVAAFLKNQPGYFRFVSSAGYWPFTGLNVYWENVSLRPPFAPSVFTPQEQKTFETLKRRLGTLPPNWNVREKLATPMGYGDLVISDYAEFMSQKTGRINVNEVDALRLDDPKLNLLGVKYFLIDESFPSTVAEIESFNHFSLTAEINNVRIYENQAVWPRVFLHSEEARLGEAKIVHYSPNKVFIKTSANQESELVLTDLFYPGWQVLVDGQKGEIKKYQNVFRAVALGPGEHHVAFVFRPKRLYMGGAVSLSSLIILLLIVYLRKIS